MIYGFKTLFLNLFFEFVENSFIKVLNNCLIVVVGIAGNIVLNFTKL